MSRANLKAIRLIRCTPFDVGLELKPILVSLILHHVPRTESDDMIMGGNSEPTLTFKKQAALRRDAGVYPTLSPFNYTP